MLTVFLFLLAPSCSLEFYDLINKAGVIPITVLNILVCFTSITIKHCTWLHIVVYFFHFFVKKSLIAVFVTITNAKKSSFFLYFCIKH